MTRANFSIVADGAATLMIISAERASQLRSRVRDFADVMVLFVSQQLSYLAPKTGSEGLLYRC